jgi:guanylate kinase
MSKKSNTSSGKFVLIIGPSGVGKSVLIKKLLKAQPQLVPPRSATTRDRRPGEGDDQYVFVTDEEFDTMIEAKEFLEWANIHETQRSGTLIKEIVPFIKKGEIVVREVDVQGYDSIAAHPLFSGDNALQLESIFIAPESIEQLVERIKNRAPISDEELQHRIASMETELQYAGKCDHIIVNGDGDLEWAYEQLEGVII